MFAAMEDDYMRARAADVKDISERLVRNLLGYEDTDFSQIPPSVIVADDLSPSETVQMDKKKILAFVTVHGSSNSHTSILARMMNIPALIGVPLEINEIENGTEVIVDGEAGIVVFEPDEDIRKSTEERIREAQEKQRLLQNLKGKENVTLDGRKVEFFMQISEMCRTSDMLLKTMQGESVYSEANFSILEEMISRQRKSNFRHTSRSCRQWVKRK